MNDSKRGRALGPDTAPIELVRVGGVPAAKLLHGVIAASWTQTRSPLCWKGSRICNMPKGGASHLACTDQRGIMINDQLSTVSSRLLRPQLLAIEPCLVPSSQAVGTAKRGSVLTAHCSWALFWLQQGRRNIRQGHYLQTSAALTTRFFGNKLLGIVVVMRHFV